MLRNIVDKLNYYQYSLGTLTPVAAMASLPPLAWVTQPSPFFCDSRV
jgi:hypothetical protein